MKKTLLLIFALLVVTVHGQGQDFLSWKLNDRYFTAQIGAGFSSYRGELKHSGSFQNEISNLGLGLEVRLWSKIGARLEFNHYVIRGNDKNAPDSSYARQRNLSFRSHNYELSAIGIFYMRQYNGGYHKRWGWDPYLLAGIGTTFISPTTEFSGRTIYLYQLQTEGTDYSRFTMIFPVGAGIKFRINSFMNLIAEGSYRFTLSDYLDDVSGTYPLSYPENQPEVELITNRKDEIPVVNEDAYNNQLVPGGPRGEPNNKDAYLFLNFKLEIFLPSDFLRGN